MTVSAGPLIIRAVQAVVENFQLLTRLNVSHVLGSRELCFTGVLAVLRLFFLVLRIFLRSGVDRRFRAIYSAFDKRVPKPYGAKLSFAWAFGCCLGPVCRSNFRAGVGVCAS